MMRAVAESTRIIALKLQWVLRLFPSFCFGYGVSNIGNAAVYQIVDNKSQPYGPFELDISGGDILMLAIEGFVYFVLIFVVEYLIKHKSISQFISQEKQVKYQAKKYDSDVDQEFKIVE